MMLNLGKRYFVMLFFLAVVSCGGANSGDSSSSSSSSSGGHVTANAGINMGNITTVPTGQGSSGKSTVTLTNNLPNKVTLKSATYTLMVNGTVADAQTIDSANTMIDISQCGYIASGGGSCSISVSPPSNIVQGEYVINMEYLDVVTGKTYAETNVVAFSDSIPTTDTGVRYSSQNNDVYNQAGGQTTLTVPFQLTKSFSSLTATSNNSNPAFAPSISCPGNDYSAGTLCNLYVRISNTGTSSVIVGEVTVSGELLLLAQSNRQIKDRLII